MAERYDFYVHDNRKITFNLTEPIMREDSGVTDFVFHIPKILNELEVSDWQWWLVFVNAKKEKYSIALTLSDDPERPLEFNTATYTVDYAMSIKAGSVQFALEAINAGTGGAIDNEWHTLTYETKVKETLQGNQAEYAETESDVISELLQTVRTKVNQLVGGATPEVKNSKNEMTEHQKIYVLSTDSNWYYWDGSDWQSGGVYGAGVTDSIPTQGSTNAVSSGGVYDALADKADKENTPKNITPEETDADFYLSDEQGNVLLELKAGHVRTKNFDSSDIDTETDTTLTEEGKPADAKAVGDKFSEVAEDIQVVEESIPDVSGFADIKTPQETTADLFICDSRGNVVAELKDGHIRTKNFNSENVGTDIIGTTRDNTAQLYVCDSSGNVIAELADGYINTKYFDSAEIKALVEKHDTPIWKGKKWACVGDSLTESYRRASKLYHDYVSEATGISAYNMGHSGCGYAMVGGYGKNFSGIAGEIPNDADVITVFGSGNDMSAGLDIGTITDTGNTTLCGCINQTLDVIFNNHPLVPVGVITPTPWMNTEPSDTNAGATKMQNYVEAIVQICARRGIPYLDLYHCSNLHPSNATFRTLAYSKDDGEGTHPDEKGHAIIAPRFEAFLKTLLLV